MLADFNAWLAETGHREWSRETFGPRFADHQETKRHRVDKGKPRKLDGLSRPPRSANDALGTVTPTVKGRPWVWTGVRFRSLEDEMRHGHDTPSLAQGA